MESTPEPIRLFISYCHETEEHSEKVRHLAERLVRVGFQVSLDLWAQHPAVGWPRWMDQQIETADFVLVVSTEVYRRRWTGEEKKGVGRGATFESVLIVQGLHDNQMYNNKFIPILFGTHSPESIIGPLKSYSRYRTDEEAGFEDLVRRLSGRPKYIPPAPGVLPDLPPAPFARPQESTESEPLLKSIPNRSPSPTQITPTFLYGRLTARGLLDSDLRLSPYRLSADPTDDTSVEIPNEISVFLWFPHTQYMRKPDQFTPTVALCALSPGAILDSIELTLGTSFQRCVETPASKLRNQEKELLVLATAEVLRECLAVAVTTPKAVLVGGKKNPILAYRVLLDLFLFPLLEMHKRMEFDRFHLNFKSKGEHVADLMKISKQVVKSVFPKRSSSVQLIADDDRLRALVSIANFLGWILDRHYNRGNRDWLDLLKGAIEKS